MTENRLDEDQLFAGFIVGFFLAGLVALFKGPRVHLDDVRQTVQEAAEDVVNKGQELSATTSRTVREKIESVIPSDPIHDSIAEGKEAARRRRAEFGVTVSDVP
ncbi:MAG: hypothetical protein SF029_20700 [bacterium]|jgi:hypothetical protein|nr:hypothetical protein [bacterium]